MVMGFDVVRGCSLLGVLARSVPRATHDPLGHASLLNKLTIFCVTCWQ